MANILVTGANGFVGTHLVNRLKKENKVVSLVHNILPGIWQDEALSGTYRVEGDIRDMDTLRRIIARYQIDHIYHTAALSIVKTAYKDPLSVFDVNAMGTVALLEAARQIGVKKILIMNTDKVYGEGLSATEDWPYKPTEPYAASKCCQGFIAHSFRETYDMPIVMIHSCNIFGYDPFNNRIIPNVIKACLRGKSPLIFTNDSSIREYIYVEDVLNAFDRLMAEDEFGVRNITTDWIFNQEDIVLKILEHFPDLEPKYLEGDLPSQIGEQSLKSVRWDWKPTWSFDDAIADTITWFRKYEKDLK